MKDTIEFGIGFVTGRANVCKLINSYYENIINQLKKIDKKVNVTIFILYDMQYQFTKRTDFYGIIPQVYKNIKIKYITPEDIEEEKKILVSRHDFRKEEINLILGHGHAKGRNTVMYFALKRKMDYLLFWDDDEYPWAVLKNEDKTLEWRMQNNILDHINNIKNSDITIGHHCGYISPIPYMQIGDDITEEAFKEFIEGISNDIVNWENIKEIFEKDNGVTYANKEILDNDPYEIQYDGVGKWIAGSTLCLNLKSIYKIPAFYNPNGARGEDTFFSTLLKDTKVLRIPTYHFHDGFLKYPQIMRDRLPKNLRKINVDEESIEHRFLQASLGWIKYKPLLMYIKDKKNYKENIINVKEKLKMSIPQINEMFNNTEFEGLLYALDEADRNVAKNYKEYLKTNEVWSKLKNIS